MWVANANRMGTSTLMLMCTVAYSGWNRFPPPTAMWVPGRLESTMLCSRTFSVAIRSKSSSCMAAWPHTQHTRKRRRSEHSTSRHAYLRLLVQVVEQLVQVRKPHVVRDSILPQLPLPRWAVAIRDGIAHSLEGRHQIGRQRAMHEVVQVAGDVSAGGELLSFLGHRGQRTVVQHKRPKVLLVVMASLRDHGREFRVLRTNRKTKASFVSLPAHGVAASNIPG